MSLTVNLYYNGKNGDARKFAQEMEDKGIAGRIRAEEGNEKYDYFIPMDDPETVLLIDSWRDQKALEAHHASPMMKELADLREKYDLHMRVERYISDDSGVPASDRIAVLISAILSRSRKDARSDVWKICVVRLMKKEWSKEKSK